MSSTVNSSLPPVVVLGASGMLGHRVVRRLSASRPVVAVMRSGPRPEQLVRVLRRSDVREVDALTDESIGMLLDDVRPAAVVNAAGVIKQRPAAADLLTMIETNSMLPHRLARACGARGVRLIHVSSDCVFSGHRGNYREDDLTDAIDAYGRSKALGEPVGEGSLSLRTSIIGPELGTAFGLLEWIRSRAGKPADGFRKVIFPGLPTIRLARVIETVLDEHPSLSGLYHVATTPISKHDLLHLINDRYRFGISIRGVDEPVSDRSLDGSRFVAATGITLETWPELVDEMARDEESCT